VFSALRKHWSNIISPSAKISSLHQQNDEGKNEDFCGFWHISRYLRYSDRNIGRVRWLQNLFPLLPGCSVKAPNPWQDSNEHTRVQGAAQSNAAKRYFSRKYADHENFENFSENIFFFKISKIIFQEVEIISEGSGSLLCF